MLKHITSIYLNQYVERSNYKGNVVNSEKLHMLRTKLFQSYSFKLKEKNYKRLFFPEEMLTVPDKLD